MTDTVERLRAGEACADTGFACNHKNAASGCLCAIAADEINRLRAALVQIMAVCDDNRSDDNNSVALALKFVRDVADKAAMAQG